MPDSPSLYGRTGLFKGISIPLPVTGLVLGRETAGEGRLAFDDGSDISRTHCTIRYDAQHGAFGIVDHGSSNGTFLMPEGQRLQAQVEVSCRPGQTIRLGQDNTFELMATTLPHERAGAHAGTGLPRLAAGQRLDVAAVRAPYERFYFAFVCVPSVVALLALLGALFADPWDVWYVVAVAAVMVLLSWVAWRLFWVSILGHGIRVGPSQYPQIHALVTQACDCLGIAPPVMVILQGHGVFELFVARQFSRRGLLIVTSNMIDDLIEQGSSRELMFFVGRQLGLIASGYFDWWIFKHLLGRFAFLFHQAWERRCHLTADRLGLLVCGDAQAAEQAMLILTAGSGLAANTNMQAIRDQRAELFDSVWAWIALGLSSYPYMVDRIILLREFAAEAAERRISAGAPVAIGALPLQHRPLRALPLLIVHGHDMSARLELVNFLQRKFPHVKPVLMVEETDAARTLPEKFERLGLHARGALALLTPDDVAMARGNRNAALRARQNVIMEIGYVWGRFGRQRLLMLARGDIEIPSDLSGVDFHRYGASPIECSEAVRDFIDSLETASS